MEREASKEKDREGYAEAWANEEGLE